ncbi:MAG: hypothetical protein JW997_05455, partial [Actinobacteria bacterium]|nr:hypothetical protein [Actinomycetota bacterium]
ERNVCREIDSGKKDRAQILLGERVSCITSYVLEKNKLPVMKDYMQKQDYIFIDDAAMAVYRAALKKDLSGIFNVSSNTETTASEIMEILAGLENIKQIHHSKKSNFFNAEIVKVSNTKLKNAIDWQPCVTIEMGLERCVAEGKRIMGIKKKNKKAAAKPNKVPPAGPKRGFMTALAIFENLLLFLIFAFLQWGELFFKINLPAAVMDYSIVYIIIVAIIWGQLQAYLAVFLSSALFIAINILTGTDIITFIYTPENLLKLAVYLLVGIITGYSIERRNREIKAKEIAIDALSKKYSFLLEIYNQTKIVKNELESQVISTEDSFSAIYEAIKKVDSLEIEAVYSGAINAIEKIMKTDSVSIYTAGRNGSTDYLRLKARSSSLAGIIPNSINVGQNAHFRYVIEGKCRYIKRDFETSIPIIMAPVIDGKKVIAVISIHSAEFENLTSHYENLFVTVISLINSAIKRAYYFENSFKGKKHINGTNILDAESFEKILSEMKKYKDRLGMGFSLLTVSKGAHTLEQMSESISKIIRENDYMGISANGDINIILSNTENDNAHIVIERLKKNGIGANLENGEDEYV